MALSSDLISQFVKITKDDKKVPTETTVYGTVVYDGKPYVKLDGSDLLTPISTTTDVKDGERVTVMIKDHTATVTGNISSPSARTDAVKDSVGHTMTADDIQASNAHIERLLAVLADIDYLNADEVKAITADIEKLRSEFATIGSIDANSAKILTAEIENIAAKFGDFSNITVDDLEALNAEITTLKGYTADFTYISAERFEAVKANIKQLGVDKLSADEAAIKYANIDFANIGEAAFNKLFSESGMIDDLIVSDGKITGTLVGVTVIGDIIKGGTVYADKLVIKGEDGLFYKINAAAQLSQRKLEYIESTGTQYIDTGVIADNNTRVVMDVEPTNDNSPTAFFGTRVSATNSNYGFVWTGTDLRSDYNNVYTQKWTASVTERRTIDKDGETTTVDGVTQSYTNSEFTTPNTLKLLAMDANGTIQWHMSAKLYSCQIYDDGNLVRDFIPVMNFDGTPCLYDKVEEKIYHNAGTGTFGKSSETFVDGEQVASDALHGSAIVAKSVTAEKVAVDDLVAFGATIGGFHIGANSLYSGAKESVDAGTIPGVYMDSEGQFVVGDGDNYLKFYKDENGQFRLAISADTVLFGDGSKASLDDIRPLTEHVKVKTWVDETGNERPCVELAEGDSDFKQVITNVSSRIMDGGTVVTEMNTEGVETENITVRNEIRQGQWAWVQHGKGNLGLIWKEVSS